MEDTEVLEALKRAQRDSKWVSDNYDKLQERYENRVFAVKDSHVIEDDDTIEGLMRKLQDRGEDATFILIEAIPPRDASFIL